MPKEPWQTALSNLITDPLELLTILELNKGLLDDAYAASKNFPLKVPREFVARMQKGNPDDPLLKQVLPLGQEIASQPDYVTDPLQEANANPVPGLLHKYMGRVLVTLTGTCAVHCRYCFRRHFPYADNNPGKSGWEKMFAYIAQDPTISEVILSGGDPLVVSDRLLQQFTSQLESIPHVKRLRIHTRLPIVLPSRITENFMNWLKALSLDAVIVVHANHANEISAEVKSTLLSLRNIVPLLNQAVLLKGVNDDVATLCQLSETLFAAGVLPYYLHVLDKVLGTQHFDLALKQAKRLHAGLKACLPGYLVPRLVREEPAAYSKTWIA